MAHFMPPHLAPSAPHLAAFFEHQMKVKAEIAAAAEAAAKATKSQNESDDGGDDDEEVFRSISCFSYVLMISLEC